MLTVPAIELVSTGAAVAAVVALVVLVILWKTLKFAFKVGLIVLAGFLIYKAGELYGLWPGPV